MSEYIDDIEVGVNSLYGENYPTSNLKNSNVLTPAAKDLDYTVNQKYQILDRFAKIKVPYRLFNTVDGSEKIIDLDVFNVMSEDEDFVSAVEKGAIQIEEIMQTRIAQCSSIGDTLLYEYS